MRLAAGTSGFSYAQWRGPFYPEDLDAADMLRFYAGRLPAVEINNTFYRMPSRSVLERWAGEVPEGFRFAVKAPRRITHVARLKEAAADPTRFLLDLLGALGPRLGAVLFQCPPNLKLDLARLDAFLALLPDGLPAAFEMRHPSWACGDAFERLRRRGFAWVTTDDDEGAPPASLVATARFGYLRLRRSAYTDAELDAWADRIRAAGWEQALVFFKHEDAGIGPALALQLAERFRAPLRAAVRPARPGPPARRVEKA
jgi:uncharacterized protein YecE (DUF72 family)